MQFYRLIKPSWARPLLANGEPNPDFKQEVPGPNVIEGCNFDSAFLTEKNQQGYNLYFFPNHPSVDVYSNGLKHLNGRVIDVFDFVFVDMDLKEKKYATKEDFYNKLKKFPLLPTMVVDSGNGVHAYWKIKNLTREAFAITQRALLKHFDTDSSVWTVLQLMRLPGSNNTKRFQDYVPCFVVEGISSGSEYELSQFPPEIYQNLTQEDEKKVQQHIDRMDGKVSTVIGEDLNLDEVPEDFLNLMAENDEVADLFNDPKSYGDRSAADMKLANILFKYDFDRKQAVSVIANSEKALEKGPARLDYAALTVDKVYDDRIKCKFQSVAESIKNRGTVSLMEQVYGPTYLDSAVLGKPWRKQEILGIIAGSGVGKTAFALNIIKDIIHNNPDNDDVYVFFSIEMPKQQIEDRWIALVGENSDLSGRLYVIDTQGDDGMPRNIGLQEIYFTCRDIKKSLGKKVGAIILDHFHILSSHINVNIQPNFGIGSEQGTGWGDVQNLSTNMLASQLKNLVKTLDTFAIVLSQTTKGKGVGDMPIGKDGSYGNSQFEWIMDRIITIWQPLMRVQDKLKERFLAWQYVKIREKDDRDRVFEHDSKILTYDMKSGILNVTTQDEYQIFLQHIEQADELRRNEAKKIKDSPQYSIQVDLAAVSNALSNIRNNNEQKVQSD